LQVSLQLLQTLCRGLQSFVTLAVAKSHLLRPQFRMTVKAAARDDGYADVANQVLCKFKVVPKPESGNISHDVVSTIRLVALEPCFFQHAEQEIPPPLIARLKILVITARHTERVHARFLKRRGGANRQEVMNFANRFGDIRVSYRVTDAPAGD